VILSGMTGADDFIYVTTPALYPAPPATPQAFPGLQTFVPMALSGVSVTAGNGGDALSGGAAPGGTRGSGAKFTTITSDTGATSQDLSERSL
jgi:hypothetical protein